MVCCNQPLQIKLRAAAATFSPLAALVPERTTPELCYLQARFAGLAAYGPAAALLAEVLPGVWVATAQDPPLRVGYRGSQ